MRAAKSRRDRRDPESPCYLAYFWACSICGHDWVDDDLERQNARAASGAEQLVRRAS
jgi:hypothetical protein